MKEINIDVSVGALVHYDGYTGVNVFLKDFINKKDIKEIKNKEYIVRFTSYPVYPIEEYEVPVTINEYTEVIKEIYYDVVAKKLKEVYDNAVKETDAVESKMLLNETRKGKKYEILHSLYDIHIEFATIDTENKIIQIFVGS